MSGVEFEFSDGALERISNLAGDSIVNQIAQGVAGRVPGARVVADPRNGLPDWAHRWVVADKKHGFNGNLNRALGGRR